MIVKKNDQKPSFLKTAGQNKLEKIQYAFFSTNRLVPFSKTFLTTNRKCFSLKCNFSKLTV